MPFARPPRPVRGELYPFWRDEQKVEVNGGFGAGHLYIKVVKEIEPRELAVKLIPVPSAISFSFD